MININKNSVNNVVLTLSGSPSIYPYYLFYFYSEYSDATKYFIASDSSSYTSRFNQFSIIETSTTEVLSAATINIEAGFWRYKVYEQNSNTNLSLSFSGVGSMLEQGKVLIEYSGNSAPTNTIYY